MQTKTQSNNELYFYFSRSISEPLVGADIVGFCGQDDLPLAQTTAAVEKVEVDMEVSDDCRRR